MRYVKHLLLSVLFCGLIAACSVAPTIKQAEPTTISISPEVPTPSVSPEAPTPSNSPETSTPSILAEAPTPAEDYARLGLSDAEAATLLSLEQVDEYPLYTMHYYAEYETTSHTRDLPHANLPLANLPSANTSWACSLFAALADPASMLYGRNFDWEYSPALLLFAHPLDGYDSASVVDIAYLGFEGADALDLAEAPLDELVSLLDAPYLPFDGMNEKGLAIGMAAVPAGNVPIDSNKGTIGSVGVIRAVLDHAATVDEALEILQSYNIDFADGPPIHYLIADAQGNAALLEHFGGEIHVLRNQTTWLQATNFLVSSVASPDGQCRRYDTLSEQLAVDQGALTPQGAMHLLQNVSQDGTQWSIVYGISTGEIHVALGRDYDEIHVLHLNLTEKQ